MTKEKIISCLAVVIITTILSWALGHFRRRAVYRKYGWQWPPEK